jgi:hypothetical protein
LGRDLRRELWSADLGDQAWDCDPVNDSGDGIIGFAATPNGRWGIVGRGSGETLIIDLATGDMHESERELHVTGNVLTVRAEYSPLNSRLRSRDGREGRHLPWIRVLRRAEHGTHGHLDTASVGSSPPAGSSQDGSIVFGLDKNVVAYSVPTCGWHGKAPTTSSHTSTGGRRRVADDVAGGRRELEALDVETGERMWSVRRVTSAASPTASSYSRSTATRHDRHEHRRAAFLLG